MEKYTWKDIRRILMKRLYQIEQKIMINSGKGKSRVGKISSVETRGLSW